MKKEIFCSKDNSILFPKNKFKKRTSCDLKDFWKRFVEESDDLQGSYLDVLFKSSYAQFSLSKLKNLQVFWSQAGKNPTELTNLYAKIQSSSSSSHPI